jgi:hypothetical protein
MEDVMNPVPDAMAAAGAGNGSDNCECPDPYVPPKTITVDADCDTQIDGSSSMWAIGEFHGKTAEELSRVRALIKYPVDLYKEPEGFLYVNTPAYPKEGAVAVACGNVSAPGSHAESVTFILD